MVTEALVEMEGAGENGADGMYSDVCMSVSMHTALLRLSVRSEVIDIIL
jgi:hypothetical protein